MIGSPLEKLATPSAGLQDDGLAEQLDAVAAVLGTERHPVAARREGSRRRVRRAGVDVGQEAGAGGCAVGEPGLVAVGSVVGDDQDVAVGVHRFERPDPLGASWLDVEQRGGSLLGVVDYMDFVAADFVVRSEDRDVAELRSSGPACPREEVA